MLMGIVATLRPIALAVSLLVMLVWAVFVLDGRASAAAITAYLLNEESRTMVSWDHQTTEGGIMHVVATVEDAIRLGKTFEEWVAELRALYPPNVTEGGED